MNKMHSATKHLYTLNDSVKLYHSQRLSESDQNSSMNSSLSESEIIDVAHHHQNSQRQIQKLIKRNEQLSRTVSQLQLKNQQLYELNQLGEKRNQKHQQKQRDLIKKLSYFQVNNKQLTYQIKKISQDMGETRQNKKISENQMNEVKQNIKKSFYQKQKFVLFMKNLFQLLKKCQRHDDFMSERDKILQFLQKNISSNENNQKISCQFDLKFEMSRVDTLKEKIRSLEQDISQYKSIIEKEKSEKKRLIGSYNQKIAKLRELYQNLREKIEYQQQQNKRKIKNLLVQKNQMIQILKNKLKQSRTNKNTVDIKKSRESKKSFIGDGDFSHLELNQLNDAIQHLEMQIIKQFQQ